MALLWTSDALEWNPSQFESYYKHFICSDLKKKEAGNMYYKMKQKCIFVCD